MSREVIESYCRLLKNDKQKCMELFAEDAQLVTHGSSRALCLRGKEEILDYFVFIPPDLTFTPVAFEDKEDSIYAEITIEGINLPQVRKKWKCRFRDGLITLLEVLE